MSRGLGRLQLCTLGLLLEAGGVLATAGILAGLFDKVGPGAHSSLSRTLRALRTRGLVMTYTGISVAGHHVRVVSLTGEGASRAQEIEWVEGEEGS